MRKYGERALTQTERSRRYLDKNELVLFATRVKKNLYDSLVLKLQREGKTKKQFLIEAIERYLSR